MGPRAPAIPDAATAKGYEVTRETAGPVRREPTRREIRWATCDSRRWLGENASGARGRSRSLLVGRSAAGKDGRYCCGAAGRTAKVGEVGAVPELGLSGAHLHANLVEPKVSVCSGLVYPYAQDDRPPARRLRYSTRSGAAPASGESRLDSEAAGSVNRSRARAQVARVRQRNPRRDPATPGAAGGQMRGTKAGSAGPRRYRRVSHSRLTIPVTSLH